MTVVDSYPLRRGKQEGLFHCDRCDAPGFMFQETLIKHIELEGHY